MNNTEFTQAENTAIIEAIRATVAETAHHADYGKGTRFAKILKAKLPGTFRVYCDRSHISVWDSSTERNNYSQRLVFYFNWTRDQEKLRAEILRECDRNDTRDYEERIAQEEAEYGAFRSLNRDLQAALAKVESLREIARAIIVGLPVPSRATIRKDAHFWNSPTRKTREAWPLIFPKD